MWSRALCVVVTCSCYSPSPLEGLPCSETDRCPAGQTCDLAFHQCAAFPLCVMPPIADSFDAGHPPCLPWGVQFGLARLDVRDGTLEITPRDDGQNSGGCLASNPIAFDEGGIFLEVPAVMPIDHGFVQISAQGGSYFPAITAKDDRLELSVAGHSIAALPYDPTAMRWWRLRPAHAADTTVADTTVAEYAADGFHWMPLGVTDIPPEPRITVQLNVGVDMVDRQPTTARIAHLGVCPPRP